uniref:Uncharacterized protein n=1 Tax=Ciona intestinalis TaxID=7719 RepID=H2Y114_CIOIN
MYARAYSGGACAIAPKPNSVQIYHDTGTRTRKVQILYEMCQKILRLLNVIGM